MRLGGGVDGRPDVNLSSSNRSFSPVRPMDKLIKKLNLQSHNMRFAEKRETDQANLNYSNLSLFPVVSIDKII
jgi:hypothetical protein